MATSTYMTYDAIGVKEDVSDIITNITPTQTPFLTSLGNEKVTQKLFQWQTDVLRSPNSVGVLEGADASAITPQPTVMLTNYTQIFVESVTVSGTIEATSYYGRARESAYQLAKSAAALKRDIETAMVGTGQDANGGSDTTARVFQGVQKLIYQGGNGTSPAYMGGPCNWLGTASTTGGVQLLESGPMVLSSGDTNAYTGGGLLQVLEQIYINGGNPSVILANPINAMTISGWVQGSTSGGEYARTRFLETGSRGDRKLINVIDIYVSPFGEQRVVNDRFLRYVGFSYTTAVPAAGTLTTSPVNNTIIYDPDMFSQMTLRPWTRETLAKTGDSLKMMIVGEFSLKCKNPRAAGVIVDNFGQTGSATTTVGQF